MKKKKKKNYVPTVNELNLKIDDIKCKKNIIIPNKNDILIAKNKLKKNINKPEPIKDHFLEELQKAKSVIYNKNNLK